jgi:hypothetical protein
MGFQDRCHQPLGHLSGYYYSFTTACGFFRPRSPRIARLCHQFTTHEKLTGGPHASVSERPSINSAVHVCFDLRLCWYVQSI